MDNHNFSFYGVADQMIWQAGPEDPRSLNAFVRVMGGPSDRNLISFSVNAGLNLKAPLPNRDDDTFGVGFGVAKVSSGASGSDMDTNTFGTSPFLVPVRGSETFLEITYQIQVTPWLQIQPDFQYIFNVGGGIPNPNNLAESIKNEAVFGFRTSITF
jgi:porin